MLQLRCYIPVLIVAALGACTTAQDETAGGHWQLTEAQDCQVWLPESLANLSVTWTGDCVDGRAAGRGELVWQHGPMHARSTDIYTGAMERGRMHGQGRLVSGGAVYEGGFAGGLRHGQGTSLDVDGARYEGGWAHGKRHGKGRFTAANGDRYNGD